jgi:hypothetical protein
MNNSKLVKSFEELRTSDMDEFNQKSFIFPLRVQNTLIDHFKPAP